MLTTSSDDEIFCQCVAPTVKHFLKLSPNEIFSFSKIDELPESVENIFKEIGRVYVPALLANEIAFKKEEKTWEVPIDDSNWSQNTFPYQVKCLNWINDEFQKLDGDEKTKTLDFLEKTGCKELIRN